MSQMDNNRQVDERTWQAWIQKTEAQGKIRFARRVKVIELVQPKLSDSTPPVPCARK